jgi:hypothetical protein
MGWNANGYCAPWSEDERATLLRLRAQGLTMREIAKQLPGRSRNAVCGEAYRMKLPRIPPVEAARRSGVAQSRTWSPARRASYELTKRKRLSLVARFSDDPASRVAEALLRAAATAERRREGYRHARS